MREPAPLRVNRPAAATGGGSRGLRTRLVLLLATVAAALGAVLGGAAPASAHAALIGSDPRQGAVLDTAPRRVTLNFSEKIAASDNAVRVLDPSGQRVDTGKLTDLSKGSKASYAVDLHAGLPEGTFTVAYQVVSADSHPVSGAYTFSIGAPSKTSAVLPQDKAGGGPVGVLYDIGRYLSYAGFVMLVGGVAFVLGCWRRGAGERAVQRLVAGGWVVLTAATLALLLLRGSYTGSGKLGDIFDLGALGDVLQTKPGAALVSRLLLLAVSALFVAVLFGTYARREDPKEKKDLTFGLSVGGGVVAAGLAATWALAEHASVGIQAGLSMPLDVLHLLAVATWLGGLTTLLVALYRVPSVEREAVRRFSTVAFTSVLVLTATGLYQSWRQVGSWSALTGTSYGQLLLVKVGLVVVLVAVAFFSRRWTARLGTETDTAKTPATATATATATASNTASAAGAGSERAAEAEVPGAPETEAGAKAGAKGGAGVGAARAAQLARQQAAVTSAKVRKARDGDVIRSGLRRSVLAEAGIAVVLLAVATLLTTTEPGRTEEEAAASTSSAATARSGPVSLKLPFDTGGENGKGTVLLDIDPGAQGDNALHLYVEKPDGTPYDVPEIKVTLTLPEKKLGPLPVEPDHLAAGHWSAEGVQIPMGGMWEVAVTVRTSDIDQVTVDKSTRIG